jgi:hypothetical protein
LHLSRILHLVLRKRLKKLIIDTETYKVVIDSRQCARHAFVFIFKSNEVVVIIVFIKRSAHRSTDGKCELISVQCSWRFNDLVSSLVIILEISHSGTTVSIGESHCDQTESHVHHNLRDVLSMSSY